MKLKDFHTPEGYCPNCWGRQEYGGIFKKSIIDKQVDVNNKVSLHSFINEFTVTYLDAIKLKNMDGAMKCKLCGKVK